VDKTFVSLESAFTNSAPFLQKFVAVKILRNDALAMPGAFEDFVKEVNVMHNLDHENLIRLYGIVLSTPLMMVKKIV